MLTAGDFILLRPRYFKLALLYFFLCATLGVFLTYWPPYLSSINFSSEQIGSIVAASLIGRAISPYVFGWWTDRNGRIVRNMFVAAVCMTLIFATSLFEPAYLYMVAIIFMFSFFWGSMMPQIDTLVLMNLGRASHHYSLLRLWGSVGFIASMIGVVPVLNYYGFISVPWTVLILCLITCFLIPTTKGRRLKSAETSSIYCVLTRPEVVLLFVICFLVQVSHGPYYSFFSIYMLDNGYGNSMISFMWSLAVIGEIAVFIYSRRMLSSIGVINLLTLSMILTMLRWLMTALFPQSIVILSIAQTLHAFSFGAYHIVVIYYIGQWFTIRQQARGQALYASISFGLGGALGSFAAGYLWDSMGGRVYFLAAALAGLCALLSIVVGKLIMPKPATA